MATTVARMEAILTANTKQFRREMHMAETTSEKVKRGIHRSAIAIGAAIGTGLGVVAKVGWDEFSQGAKVNAQVAARLKSTGGVANVTAKQIDALAQSMMAKTGIDDEAIRTADAMLLSFTKVRNEVGKNNDIFNQATQSIADVATAYNEGAVPSSEQMQKVTIQVGKALNDPIRGMSALRRVGVTFTDAQEKQITKLVESGRHLDAQKLILKELRTEFGGAAEAAGKTLPGQLAILKERFANFSGELVAGAIPKLMAVIEFIKENSTTAKVLAGILASLAATVLLTSAALKVYTAGLFIVKAATVAWTAVQWLLNAALAANPISLIVIALAALAVGLVVAWKKSETFRRIVIGAWNAVKRVVSFVIDFIREHWEFFLAVLTGGLGLAVAKVIQHWGVIKGTARAVFNWVKDHVLGVWNRIQEVGKAVWGRVTGFIDNVKGAIEEAVDAIRRLIQWFKDAPGKIRSALGDVGNQIDQAFGLPDWASGGILGKDGIVGVMGAMGAGGVGPASVSRTLYDDLSIGQSMGLSLASGYRPGATTSTGNPSLHGVFPAKAIDMAGPYSSMRSYFLLQAARGLATGLREVIFSPYWWHPGSGITPITSATVLRDHYDHVHVGSYDRGGYLQPGWNLAYNGLGRPEPVGGGNTYNFNGAVLNADALLRYIQEADRRFGMNNGRPAFGV